MTRMGMEWERQSGQSGTEAELPWAPAAQKMMERGAFWWSPQRRLAPKEADGPPWMRTEDQDNVVSRDSETAAEQNWQQCAKWARKQIWLQLQRSLTQRS